MKSEITQKNSVMIVGAGIGGCQAALDLAKLGLKVYLIEKYPLAGVFEKDSEKFIPINDCSVCLYAPKIMDVEQNPNIELIENADIVSLEGRPGNFRAKVRKRVETRTLEQCSPCDDCISNPLSKVKVNLEEKKSELAKIYPQYPENMSLKILLESRKIPPCENECPAHVKAQEYNSLISKKEYVDALNLIRDRCPLPSIIGRICNHPCETVCNRGEVDDPVNICGLKRFVADFVRENLNEDLEYLEEKKEKKVAIVGSGPSGLTVAYQLSRRGYPVTIYERESVPGGMIRLGVPNYRLPPEIVNADIEYIKRYGVEIKTNTPIGSPGLSIKDLKKEYDAVYIGVGLQNSRKLNIEGEDLKNIRYAIEFLKSCKLEKNVNVGENVIVIGGGDVAIDVARSAMRMGAEKVQMIMLESEDIIPAQPWEVEEAREEGIILNVSRGPNRFIGKNGKVVGVETLICSSVFDKNGRFNPVLEACTEEIFDGDMVIIAAGQGGDLDFLDKEVKVERGITVDKMTFQTSLEGVFAGGEIVTGPGSAIKAISTGNKAGFVIDQYLKGVDISKITETIPDYSDEEVIGIDQLEGVERVTHLSREEIKLVSAKERIANFNDITIGMDEDTAIKESERCLSCGICKECLENVKACVARPFKYEDEGEIIPLNIDIVMLSPGESWLLCYDLRKGTNYRWKVLSPVARVSEEKCICCGDCIDACNFNAIERIETLVEYNAVRDSVTPSLSLIRYKSKIIPDKCTGCGACEAVCPVSAISMKYISNTQITEIIQSYLK
jgi:NADPH-dependent glutamate synthase beta subunit-like oxidoreductase/Pyruvate/2-oxoacid:ferredoxin oxidoreductase delta subunit